MKPLMIRFGVACASVLAVVVIALAGPRPEARDETGVVLRVPGMSLIGLYAGRAQPVQRYLGPEEKEWLPVDTEVVRQSYFPLTTYSARKTGVGMLRVGVVLAGADNRSLHRPEVCLPGQGWTILDSRVRAIEVPGLGEVEVTALDLKQPIEVEGRQLILRAQYWYWWEGPGKATPSTIERTMLQMGEALVSNKVTRWAYPSVFAQQPIGLDTPPEELERRMVASMEAATVEWAPQFLVRLGAEPLSARELARAEKEAVEPLEDDSGEKTTEELTVD